MNPYDNNNGGNDQKWYSGSCIQFCKPIIGRVKGEVNDPQMVCFIDFWGLKPID
jgi:hypothetical protein